MKNLLLLTTAIFASFSGSPYLPWIAPDLPDYYPARLNIGLEKPPSIFTLNLPNQPLGQAHAHNDYEHERPLFDALENGFNFIEVDVFLIENELYVSHLYPIYLDEKSTLREMYLKPLERLIEKNDGHVFPKSDQPLYLMIDIKTEAETTYEALKSYLQPYLHFLTHFSKNGKEERAVTIFLSGNRPVEKMAAESERFMCLDGRIEDLGKGYPPELMPVVSERFSNVFGPQFLGLKESSERWNTFARLAQLTHKEGKKIRLWASPENERVWDKLLANDADLINTDELPRLRRYLHQRNLIFVSD